VAVETQFGHHLVELNKKLIKIVGYDKVQLVTLNNPDAFREYAPYHFVDTEQEFEELVRQMV
jgi:hypothetical protein